MKQNILWTAFALCAISYGFGGMASTLMSAYLPDAVPELLGGPVSEARMGEVGAYINAMALYGWMVGGLIFGGISDRIGRKKVLVLVTALYGLATILVAFADNWPILLLYRFLSGMGVGGVLLITTVYLSEIWPEKNRPVALGILAISFPVGIVATGGLAVLFPNWRDAFWLGLVPLANAGLIGFLLPESTPWATLDRQEHAPYKVIFAPQYRSALLSGALIFGAVLIGLWGIFSWLPTWVQSLMPLGSDGQKERGIAMMLLGIGGIVGGTFSGFLMRRFGSRVTLMGTFGGLIATCSLLFLTNKTFTPIIYLETAALSLFFGISQGALSGYIPGLFPTNIRASASGFCFNVGRFFTATAVFFVGALVTLLGGFGNALLSFSLMFLVALLATYFYTIKTN